MIFGLLIHPDFFGIIEFPDLYFRFIGNPSTLNFPFLSFLLWFCVFIVFSLYSIMLISVITFPHFLTFRDVSLDIILTLSINCLIFPLKTIIFLFNNQRKELSILNQRNPHQFRLIFLQKIRVFLGTVFAFSIVQASLKCWRRTSPLAFFTVFLLEVFGFISHSKAQGLTLIQVLIMFGVLNNFATI